MAEQWVRDGEIWKLGMWRIVPSSVSSGVNVYLGQQFKFFRSDVRKAKASVKRHLGFDSMFERRLRAKHVPKAIGHHRRSHDGACGPDCYYETFEEVQAPREEKK